MDVLTVKINDFQINDDVFVISDNRHKRRNSLIAMKLSTTSTVQNMTEKQTEK